MEDLSIKVSVAMITYNHEMYIAQAIEGVLIQRIKFKIELIIGDDCSTDNTSKIVKEYAQKYPETIKDSYNPLNLGMMGNAIKTLKECKGEYIALCEGDDYWTDPHKLQKQVDFLEANKDFAICHHNMQIIYDDGREPILSNPRNQNQITTIDDLALGNYIYTASCIFRNGLIGEFPAWFKESQVGDYLLHMLNAQYGKIRYFPEVMGVYRVHKDGAFGGKEIALQTEKWIKVLDLLKTHFDPKINDILARIQFDCYLRLINHYKNDPEKCKYYNSLALNSDPFFISKLADRIEELKNSQKYRIGAFILKPINFLKRIRAFKVLANEII
jgi:glycosyltransferase involved in cell wall biosynthesis